LQGGFERQQSSIDIRPINPGVRHKAETTH
jgi:hypothetical protein